MSRNSMIIEVMFLLVSLLSSFCSDKTVSTTMEKGLIFLLIICNSPTFTSGKNLQFTLGCSAVIPCQHKRGDSDVFIWFYQKDTRSEKIKIFIEGKGETPRYDDSWKDKITVRSNGSLVINSFTEDNQGLYWCDICHQDNCEPKMSTVDKEIINETSETVYVTAGDNFTHVCHSESTKWTFQASNTTTLQNPVQGPETNFITSNNIHIVNVKREDAGKYTCWTSKCYGHKQKILTINLCVITVQLNEDSSVSSDMMCDMEFKNIKPNGRLNVETDTVDPYGSLNCSEKQMVDGYSTVNSTHEPSILNKTTGPPTVHGDLTAIICGTSAGMACLILVALLIYCLRLRLPADFCDCSPRCGAGEEGEEEPSVVYSSIIIRRPAKTTNNQMTLNDCLYSEINV